ncbi:hypothetical protein [Hespellia stercorisuis]|uniref:Uncharacterized protein n=1 Tax=Hespellia stercorisuis DSM 15480 TaxID=1121950 RepID=A0A1M6M4V1_9FIRM|nr:hypothetical protein [Hespellia stercorisuis]SHJ78436.1 hypothetical protein SAMN02745243_01352 [Hespellia stercorisuis DSM 15480]
MSNSFENTTGFRKWNITFFSVFLVMFLIPYIRFETLGMLVLETRIIMLGMIAILIFGLVRSILLLRVARKRAKTCKSGDFVSPMPAR